jgi:tetratricopeptide (TPR) repeat protein
MSFRLQDRIAQALEHLEPALALSRQVGDPILSGRILNHIGFSYFNVYRHNEAIRAHDEARQLLEKAGDQSGLAESLHELGENLVFQAHFHAGLERLSASVQVSEQVGNRSLAGENRYMKALALWKLGEYAQAAAEVSRSIATLTEIGDAWNLSFALGVATVISTILGDFGRALDAATRGLSLARQLSAVRPAASNLRQIGVLYREIENYLGAWQADSEMTNLLRGAEVRMFGLPASFAGLALDAVGLGRIDDAVGYARHARQALEEVAVLDQAQDVAYAEGRVLLALGKIAEARDAAAALLETADSERTYPDRVVAPVWKLPALLLKAEATLALGAAASALSGYRQAVEEGSRLGCLPALWRALAGLSDACRTLGQIDEAEAAAHRAHEITTQLAVTIPDERLRATFLQSAVVQRLGTRGP